MLDNREVARPDDRKGRPYISCRSSLEGYVGATLAVVRQKLNNSPRPHALGIILPDNL